MAQDNTSADDSYVTPDVRLVQALQHSWKEELLVDYTIQVGYEQFKVHKVVMASVSDYFKVMLTGAMVESKTDSVNLEGQDPLAVSNIIEYIYTNRITGARASPEDLLGCAVYLQIPSAIEAASRMILSRIDIDNCFDILVTFNGYFLTDAAERTKDYMRTNLDELLEQVDNANCFQAMARFEKHDLKDAVRYTRKYLNTNVDQILEVHSLDRLPYDDALILTRHWLGAEPDLILTIKDWVESDYENRKQHLDSLMSHVRFSLLTPAQLEAVNKMKMYSDGSWWHSVQEAQQYHKQTVHERIKYATRSRTTPVQQVVCFSDDTTSTMYILEKDGHWESKKVPATPKFADGAVASIEFKNFLIVCERYFSQKWHVFDPMSLTWSSMAGMNTRRDNFALVHDEKYLYALGGCTDLGEDSYRVIDTMERYDMEVDTWTIMTAKLPVPLHRHIGCLCYGAYSSIFVTGGQTTIDDDDYQSSTQLNCFDPRLDPIVWKSKAPMLLSGPVFSMAQMYFGNRTVIIVLCKYKVIQIYDLHFNQWSRCSIAADWQWHDNGTALSHCPDNDLYIVNVWRNETEHGVCAKWLLGRTYGKDVNRELQKFPILTEDWDEYPAKNYIAAVLSFPTPPVRRELPEV